MLFSALALLLAPAHGWLLSSKLAVTTSSKLPLTPALRAAADDKLGKELERYDKFIQLVKVNFKVEKRHVHDQEHKGLESHVAEVTALCRDKQVIRVRHASEDMYASLDLLADGLSRKLRKYKERRAGRTNDQLSTADAFVADTVDEEAARDDEEMAIAAAKADAASASDASATAIAAVAAGTGKAMGQSAGGPWQLVREKKFPMPPIAIEEAIVCLEYIEHGFYAFRNVETNEINVVYKRDEGGVGWIQPSDQ